MQCIFQLKQEGYCSKLIVKLLETPEERVSHSMTPQSPFKKKLSQGAVGVGFCLE